MFLIDLMMLGWFIVSFIEIIVLIVGYLHETVMSIYVGGVTSGTLGSSVVNTIAGIFGPNRAVLEVFILDFAMLTLYTFAIRFWFKFMYYIGGKGYDMGDEIIGEMNGIGESATKHIPSAKFL